MTTIFHIAHQQDWDSALDEGFYESPTLDKEGFIHCSTDTQVLRVANNFYRGLTDLLLLVIDTDKLAVPVQFEAPINPQTGQPEAGVNELFPHIYGAINTGAVDKVLVFQPQADGSFVFPQI